MLARRKLLRRFFMVLLRGGWREGLGAQAIYMGHSVTMQRETYDRRTKDQKVCANIIYNSIIITIMIITTLADVHARKSSGVK